MKTRIVGQGVLAIRIEDLTLMEVDAIVNAANPALAGGGGVDGAIHTAAGSELANACKTIIRGIGSLPPGQAVITPGFNLPARFIIHTVGPIWRGGQENEEDILSQAFENSLALARDIKLKTVAFPAISTGSYGYPMDAAARIAMTAIISALEKGWVETATVCLHSEQAFATWGDRLEDLLPSADQ